MGYTIAGALVSCGMFFGAAEGASAENEQEQAEKELIHELADTDKQQMLESELQELLKSGDTEPATPRNEAVGGEPEPPTQGIDMLGSSYLGSLFGCCGSEDRPFPVSASTP